MVIPLFDDVSRSMNNEERTTESKQWEYSHCHCSFSVVRCSFFIDSRREAAPHGVLCNSPGQQELQQIIGAAGLRTQAGELEAAEGLPADQGPGDLTIDI